MCVGSSRNITSVKLNGLDTKNIKTGIIVSTMVRKFKYWKIWFEKILLEADSKSIIIVYLSSEMVR